MFDQIISKYGATAKAKLSSPAITGAPEDNIRAPLEELIVDFHSELSRVFH